MFYSFALKTASCEQDSKTQHTIFNKVGAQNSLQNDVEGCRYGERTTTVLLW